MPTLNSWHCNRFTGLFRSGGFLPLRAHDPQVHVWAGTPAYLDANSATAVGGASWSKEKAELAGLGEAIERLATHALPGDTTLDACFADWGEKDPAVDPRDFVLFHPEQYAQVSFEPLTRNTKCQWVRYRTIRSGEIRWVPKELAFMDLRFSSRPRFGPNVSTGWSAHRTPQEALSRGVREVIERDAVMGAWWGAYPLYEHSGQAVFHKRSSHALRVCRPNLRYRFYRIDSPYSSHVTIVTVEGEDEEGLVFSIGSACRATLMDSWEKALLEAIQGRHYARYLLASTPACDVPRTFAQHTVFYSHNRERLEETPLTRAPQEEWMGENEESLTALLSRLPHPPLFRLMTPPPVSEAGLDWVVVRVIAPGLQPLHGDHTLPYLGGELWGDRPISDYDSIPPHPFA
jgi:ribosomal protein S12 methylthiotransferase accessory factor